MVSTQSNVLPEKNEKEMNIEVTDIDLPSNSSFNTTDTYSTDQRRADAKWLKNVRYAIEGVTQLLVGLVGLIGKAKMI